MRSVVVEGVEYTCLDITPVAKKDTTFWFKINEESHLMNGTMFGIQNVEQDGDKIDFDIITKKDVDMEVLQPIVNDFVIVMMGEYVESQSTE